MSDRAGNARPLSKGLGRVPSDTDPRLRRFTSASASSRFLLGDGLELDRQGRIALKLPKREPLYIDGNGVLRLRLGKGLVFRTESPTVLALDAKLPLKSDEGGIRLTVVPVELGGTGGTSPGEGLANLLPPGSEPGEVLYFNGNIVATRTEVRTAGVTIESGSGDVLTTGDKGSVQVPYNGTVIAWAVVADQAGDIEFEIEKSSLGGARTSITGTTKPGLSGASTGDGSSMAGWTTSIPAYTQIHFSITSVATITSATLFLHMEVNS